MDPLIKWNPSPAQRDILLALQIEAGKEKSNAAFAREYLGFGPEKLSKIFAALSDDPARRSYFDEIKNPDAELEDLAEILTAIQMRRERQEAMAQLKLHRLDKQNSIISALRQCLTKSGPERLVIFRAPSGGGKTMLCVRLVREMKARVVQTRRGWKTSYCCVLQDIATAIGLTLGGECRTSIIEDAIKEFCRLVPFILAIDEGEYFGADAINGIKWLLNNTQITILICVIPEAHDRWARYHKIESQQIRRRQHAAFEQSAVTTQDCARFFPPDQFADTAAALASIATAASVLGHFSFVNTVAEKLEGQKAASADAVKKAIDAAKRRMRIATDETETHD